MRKFSVHPDNGGGLDLDLSSVREGQGLIPAAVQKPSRLKQKPGIKDLKKENLVIFVLIVLSAAVAAFIVLT